MGRHFKIIINNLKSVLGFKRILLISIIYIVVFYAKINILSQLGSLYEYVAIIFQGPKSLSENIMELFIWSLYQFYLIYIIGDYFYRELKIRNVYVFSRIGNKTEWFLHTQFTSIIVCITYYLIGIILIALCGFTLNRQIIMNNKFCDIVNIFFILSLSSYFITTVYIALVVIIKKHNVSFLILILVLYLSIEVGYIFKIDAYIPFTQGILIKHLMPNIGFFGSCLNLSFFIIINYYFIKRYIVKNDFLTIMD